jgi:hypothetical protein
VATITPASATEGSDVVFDFTLSNPSAVDTSYTFVLTNGTAGSADYTTTDVIVTVPAGQLLERYRYQQLRIQLMKWTKLSLLMELFRLRVQLSTITMHLLWQRSLLLRLPKDLMWYSTLRSNPSAVDTSYTLF